MAKSTLSIVSFIIYCMAILASCEKITPPLPADDELLDGPVGGLDEAQNRQHLLGDVAFNDQIFTNGTGLGPVFVATSCGSCHAGDGKGHPFTTLTRFGQVDSLGNKFLKLGGPQLQNRALPGHQPEQIPAGATFAEFTPPINSGLGFIELVPDADILDLVDPYDTNGDGISGVPNWNTIPFYVVPIPNSIQRAGKYIGRFGKKASVRNLLQQTVNAYNQDMGITSHFEPVDAYSLQEVDPEISIQEVHDVVFYLQTLKAPIQRNQNDDEVILGKQVFNSINCASCHTPTLKTSYSPIASLSNKEFHPYTDLLLHDMGSDLDDGYTEGSAKTSEWRTPPLWGLGLAPNSQGGEYFLLHDGRAKSIEEAITMHGGEAEQSRNKFNQLSEKDRDALIKFLKSL